MADTPTLPGPVLATHGMVASEHPLVSQTGVDVLRRGGNAFDVAIAMSALLPVVKPSRSHLGGDAYILVWPKKEGRVSAISKTVILFEKCDVSFRARSSRGFETPTNPAANYQVTGFLEKQVGKFIFVVEALESSPDDLAQYRIKESRVRRDEAEERPRSVLIE